jgi:hypothetical protein
LQQQPLLLPPPPPHCCSDNSGDSDSNDDDDDDDDDDVPSFIVSFLLSMIFFVSIGNSLSLPFPRNITVAHYYDIFAD